MQAERTFHLKSKLQNGTTLGDLQIRWFREQANSLFAPNAGLPTPADNQQQLIPNGALSQKQANNPLKLNSIEFNRAHYRNDIGNKGESKLDFETLNKILHRAAARNAMCSIAISSGVLYLSGMLVSAPLFSAAAILSTVFVTYCNTFLQIVMRFKGRVRAQEREL